MNRLSAGGSAKLVSDGAAFNRLLCLSQLCYVMASNTWANTLEMLCAHRTAAKVKMGGWGGGVLIVP